MITKAIGMIRTKENETMTCEKSQLRDWSKMWKMHYIGFEKDTTGPHFDACEKIENTVKNSDYADSTKKKWQHEIDRWLEAR